MVRAAQPRLAAERAAEYRTGIPGLPDWADSSVAARGLARSIRSDHRVSLLLSPIRRIGKVFMEPQSRRDPIRGEGRCRLRDCEILRIPSRSGVLIGHNRHTRQRFLL
jgi:hypothetical protein